MLSKKFLFKASELDKICAHTHKRVCMLSFQCRQMSSLIFLNVCLSQSIQRRCVAKKGKHAKCISNLSSQHTNELFVRRNANLHKLLKVDFTFEKKFGKLFKPWTGFPFCCDFRTSAFVLIRTVHSTQCRLYVYTRTLTHIL